jgi:hypothetical protein
MARGGKRAGAGRKPNAAGKKARKVSDLTHGGRRAGAGRTLGAATKKTRAIADQAAADGNITPLEVMLHTMRTALLEGDLHLAVSIARDAAPYCHPRLSAITVKENIDVSTMSDQELEERIRLLQEEKKPPGAVH